MEVARGDGTEVRNGILEMALNDNDVPLVNAWVDPIEMRQRATILINDIIVIRLFNSLPICE